MGYRVLFRGGNFPERSAEFVAEKHRVVAESAFALFAFEYAPAALIGAKLGAPDREVVLFAGDGGLQMTIQELATIFQSHVCVKIVLLNNSFLGMVRQWQELFYDRRYSSTEMVNPDFGLIARANGIEYRCVERRGELPQAVAAMKAHAGAYLLEVRVENEENVFPMVPAGAPVADIRLE